VNAEANAAASHVLEVPRLDDRQRARQNRARHVEVQEREGRAAIARREHAQKVGVGIAEVRERDVEASSEPIDHRLREL